MLRTSRLVLLVLLATTAVAAADKGDLVGSQLTALRTAARCSDAASPYRPWCIATEFAKGTSAPLPTGKVLVGMTIELQAGKDAGDALTNSVTFAALAIGKDGKVKLTDVKSTSDAETQMIGEAVFNTAAVFKGKATTAKLPTDLADYAKTLKGTYKPAKAGAAWTWQGASLAEMRKVGPFWVVIETPTAGSGIFATILTDAWQ